MQKLTLQTSVGTLAANLFLPEIKQDKYPVVIVTGAWTTVKEQMPNTYAKALIKQGFAALTFDFRGWGETSDPIQYLEDPTRKTQDILAVIQAIKTIDNIDANNIFGLGVCASSSYMLDACAKNKDIRAAGAIAPWLHNKALVNSIYGGEDSVNNLISLAKNADPKNAKNHIEAASLTNDKALMYQAPYYTEKDRGLIAQYDNKFNIASWQGWLEYDAIAKASEQDKPILLVGSEAMALPAGAKEYLQNAGKNVSAIWLDNVTQFDFYDVEIHVSNATKHITEFFRTHLS